MGNNAFTNTAGAGSDVIIACDFPTKDDTLRFLDLFESSDRKPFVKIGMELFYAEGPDIVREIKARGHRIFLDLKLCDIPNTVERAMRVIARLGVDITNVHAAGGIKMMEAALRGLRSGRGDTAGTGTNCDGGKQLEAGRGGDTGSPGLDAPKLIAVTQLTSTDQDMLTNELLIERDMNNVIASYAMNAKKAGLAGVVCSPLESALIHDKVGSGFITVTPGIRFPDSAADDQSRITTPEKARELGSDYIVVGRAVTKADDPVSAYERCVREFTGE